MLPGPPLHGKGRVYLLPLGEFPSAVLSQLVSYYKDKYDLTIETLPPIELESAVFDPDRQQLIAEELIALMKRHYPALANDPEAVLIGLTQGDMYIQMFNWRFAFGFYDTAGRFGVISSARMDPAQFPRYKPRYVVVIRTFLRRFGLRFEELSDSELLLSRIRKMTTRYIGLLHYRLSPRGTRKSVLYRSILGIDDLDSIGEEF